ncbi:MAG: hypothetical protein ACTHN5_07295 [Phycisphaerae bacterium]
MMALPRRLLLGLALSALTLWHAAPADAWSHQGHMLITRLAALRIIDDPAAPEGLRAFLKANMPWSMADCQKLAEVDVIGGTPQNLTGFDAAATLPDRIQFGPDGKKLLEPFKATEFQMHFVDLEFLGKEPVYKPDASDRPALAEIPRDFHDPRWKAAGYLPFRIEECYRNLTAAFATGESGKISDNDVALHWAGYLAHYLEDAHQPHHSTVDYRSLYYLAAAGVPGVHAIHTRSSDGHDVVTYKCDSPDINVHGAIEYQLFENADEPRKTLRRQFWTELTSRINAHARELSRSPVGIFDPSQCIVYDGFTRTFEILFDSYDCLPAVGKAGAAAYATGKFDVQAFFTSEDIIHNRKMTMIQLIADRNAQAVLEVESTWRRAWADAHPE